MRQPIAFRTRLMVQRPARIQPGMRIAANQGEQQQGDKTSEPGGAHNDWGWGDREGS